MNSLSRRSIVRATALGLVASRLPRRAPRAPAASEQGSLPGRTPHTRFAVNVEMWWSSLPFLDRIRRAADLGFPAVEFWGLGGKDVAAIADLCRERRVEVSQFTAWGFEPGLNDPVNHAAFVDAVGAACQAAKTLGAKLATVVGGNDQPGMSQAQMHANITEGLRKAAPVAEAGGLTLILEPMNVRVDHAGHCLYGSAPAVAICRAVGSPSVKINWDLYHAQISEGDLCGRLREGFDQLGYAQVADNPGRHEPGTGEIHYPRVLRQLHELGYRGFVGLECSPLEGEDAAAARVAAADRW